MCIRDRETKSKSQRLSWFSGSPCGSKPELACGRSQVRRGGKGRAGISTPLTSDRGNGAKGRDDDGGAKGKAGHDYEFLGMSGCSLG